MKNIIALIILIGFLFLNINKYCMGEDMGLLKLGISSEDQIELTAKQLLIRITFDNISSKEINILKSFEDNKTLPIWFSISLKSDDGTPISGISSGGKITIRSEKKYITLGPQEGFFFYIDISKLLPNLKEGTYQLMITYHNQYGQDCFKGQIDSNIVKIKIVDSKSGGK